MSTKKRKYKSCKLLSSQAPEPFREGYALLLTNLGLNQSIDKCQSILITSTHMGEGKSSIALNLACALATQQHRVLVIEANLHTPSMHRYLRIKQSINGGLSTVLSGKQSIWDAIYYDSRLNVDILLAGPNPYPDIKFCDNQIKDIVHSLEDAYDVILVDAPAISHCADALLLAQAVDGVMFVVKQKYAMKTEIKRAFSSFTKYQINIVGVVMNDYDSSKNIYAPLEVI